jgi:hypothetical protein
MPVLLRTRRSIVAKEAVAGALFLIPSELEMAFIEM